MTDLEALRAAERLASSASDHAWYEYVVAERNRRAALIATLEAEGHYSSETMELYRKMLADQEQRVAETLVWLGARPGADQDSRGVGP